MTDVKPPRPASVLLVVDTKGRILAGQRNPSMPFLGGIWSFPGGGVSKRQDGPAEAGGFERAALRELHEETGLHPDVLGLNPGDLRPLVRWVTPPWSPMRFDTQFFHVALDQDVPSAAIEPLDEQPELLGLDFHEPAELLRRWEALDVVLAPPAFLVLHALEKQDPRDAQALAAALAETEGQTHEHFEPMPGIRMLPLRSPTLPPATHTNAYILGHERMVVVDPATEDESERARLLRVLNRIHRPLEAIFLTHHHADHVAAAAWLKDETGAPIWAHPETARLVDLPVDDLFEDGDELDLGRDEQGRKFLWRLLHTPGHAAGHLCLQDERPGARGLICGDMVASIGTIIVDPDDGDMATYVAQLERLEALGDTILMPSHGGPIFDGATKLRQYIDHRRARSEKVRAALEAFGVPARPEDLLPQAYADADPKVWPLAARSCLAHLIEGVTLGWAERSSNDRFRPKVPR
ncbi:MAG: MBL fold metallo-hydrolase [Myxococcota bacterium]